MSHAFHCSTTSFYGKGYYYHSQMSRMNTGPQKWLQRLNFVKSMRKNFCNYFIKSGTLLLTLEGNNSNTNRGKFFQEMCNSSIKILSLLNHRPLDIFF
jgi:hypothetical protein